MISVLTLECFVPAGAFAASLEGSTSWSLPGGVGSGPGRDLLSSTGARVTLLQNLRCRFLCGLSRAVQTRRPGWMQLGNSRFPQGDRVCQ